MLLWFQELRFPPEVLEHVLCYGEGRREVAVLTALCWKLSPFHAGLHCGFITACGESRVVGGGNSVPFRWLLGPTEKEAARTLEASYIWIRLKITSNYQLG